MSTPMPDAATIAHIRSMDRHLDGGLMDFADPEFAAVGDTFTICNRSACVKYTRMQENRFEGGDRKAQVGGGAGGGGGGFPGAGDGGGGGGPVCEVASEKRQACSSVDGGEQVCVPYVYETMDCG